MIKDLVILINCKSFLNKILKFIIFKKEINKRLAMLSNNNKRK
jgi:hypothetical protein